MALRYVDAAEVARALPFAPLIERLRQAFIQGADVPLRHHHAIPGVAGHAGGTLLLMPAWQKGGPLGIKAVSVFPDNQARGLPSVMGLYLLLDGTTGEPSAVLDGVALTLRRTAAASALAAGYLARPDAREMLMVGAGALAPHMIAAHATMRSLIHVKIWNRTPGRAKALAGSLSIPGIKIEAVDDLRRAAQSADIISCATMSPVPLIKGEWLRPGQHLDLVGAYRADMRETDDEAVQKAQLFVDTRQGGLKEAGDIVDPLRRGIITEASVKAELSELCQGKKPGRQQASDITLFKSVGTALEDLAAATLVMERS